jgi:Phosphotransferase enzyme family
MRARDRDPPARYPERLCRPGCGGIKGRARNPRGPVPTNRMSTPPSPGALVGRGYTADVYAWGAGRVLKLFHAGGDPTRAEREYRATRAVHAAGLPAPAAYELVEIDGRRGIVLERIDGPSLVEYAQRRPWALFWGARRLAELHAEIHRCQAPAELPSQRDWLAGGIDTAPDVSEADRDAARRQLAELPDGTAVCHGDFHPGNVLLTPRGPVVIDWGAATRGYPLGDVACTLRLMQTARLPSWMPRPMHWLLACTRPLLHRTYLGRYLRLGGGTRRQIEAWRVPVATARSGRAGFD